jgi:ABC-type nitrate/sulfonate/bicarbonate transport system ATPase subunit
MIQYTKAERLLTVENVSIAFGEKVILRDVNLHVDNIVRPGMSQGQTVALLGPSGVGKTQLFRAIAGLLAPSAGTIRLNGEKEPVQAGRIGVVQQAYPLLQHRTVLSNLRLAARSQNGSAAAEIDRLLAHFGLLDKKNSYPLELSGGQRQRIAIIQQLLRNNHFLLMDEPFSGLDPIAKERAYDTIRTVTTAHEHNTVIFTTHDLESAVRLADEIWVLGREEGKVGATVRARIDLIQAGLAWQPDIDNHPAFWPKVQELYALFKTL